MIKRGLGFVVCGLGMAFMGGCGLEGIHSANPQTIIRVDPVNRTIYLANSKDVDLSVDELTVDPAGKSFALKKLHVTDNASLVRQANGVYQMAGLAMQAQTNWAGAAQTVGALGEALAPWAGVFAAARTPASQAQARDLILRILQEEMDRRFPATEPGP